MGGSVSFYREQSSKSQGSFINQKRPLKIGRNCPQQKKYTPLEFSGLEDVFVSFQKWLFFCMFFRGCTLQGTIAPSKNLILKSRDLLLRFRMFFARIWGQVCFNLYTSQVVFPPDFGTILTVCLLTPRNQQYLHTVDGSEIPFPTTVWMMLKPCE